MADDPLSDFDRTSFMHQGKERAVFRAGGGPAVIVISEMPGITPKVAGRSQPPVTSLWEWWISGRAANEAIGGVQSQRKLGMGNISFYVAFVTFHYMREGLESPNIGI